MAEEQHLAISNPGLIAGKPFSKEHLLKQLMLAKAKSNKVFMREVDLSGVDLSGVDLSGVDLSRANLSGADLRGADLSGANLSRANLIKADFRMANLSRVNLSQADLSEANLSEANLSGADLSKAILSKAILGTVNFNKANLSGVNLSGANLRKAKLRGAKLHETDLSKAYLSGANLSGADLIGANLSGADLIGANLSRANLSRANLKETNLGKTNLREANFSGADLSGINLNGKDLSGTNLVGTDLRRAVLSNCRIYGISAWDVRLEGAEQLNLIITPADQPTITVDNLKVAQFIYLLLKNQEIRDAIDTITYKVILILGRFTNERKRVLNALKVELRKRGYVPILFDFEVPETRDVTETITTLARLSHFVIADLTDARSIPQELAFIVPALPSVPVQPILHSSQKVYGLFEHFKKFPWVLPIYHYSDRADLLKSLEENVIVPAVLKAQELGKR